MFAVGCTSSDEPTTALTLRSLETTTTVSADTTTTTTAIPTLWAVDTCLDLGTNAAADYPHAPYGEELTVDCGGPHTHEFFFVETLAEGPGAPFPEGLGDRLWAGCHEAFTERMGFPASESTLDVVLYLPDEDEWAAGERYHGCVLHQPGTQVVFRPLVGSVFDHPGDYRWEVAPGSCYAVLGVEALAISEPAPCDEIHTFEAIGETELDAQISEYPGLVEHAELGDEACEAVLSDAAAPDAEELEVFAFAVPAPVTAAEWQAGGGRHVKCFLAAGSPEGGLLLMTGSLTEGTLEIIRPGDSVSVRGSSGQVDSTPVSRNGRSWVAEASR